MTVTEKKPDASSDVLRQEILNQSEAEASNIIKQAEVEVERIIQKAEKDTGRIRGEALKKAEAQAGSVRKKILSSVQLEIQQAALRAREDLLGRILDTVLENLIRFRQTKAYIPYVKQFVLEGVRALGGVSGTVKVIPGEVERKILTKTLMTEIEKEANARSDEQVHLELSKKTADEGGVILVSEDERIRFDNRFSSRMERFGRSMRLEANRRILE